MAMTEPIRDKKQLKILAAYFLDRRQYRNYTLLVIGAYTALRISDILCLKWMDVYDEKRGEFYTHISLAEKKTSKGKTIALHPQIIAALRLSLPQKRGDFIFTGNRKNMAAISRVQAWRILRDAAKAADLSVKVSGHALRKTFGYHAWKSGVSPVLIMDIYNHSSYEVTRRYLGVAQDDTDRAYITLNLL
jgi:integrase